jgi:hypothetical protein
MRHLFIVLFILSPAAGFGCANKIDPSKVMLFVDTNKSDSEISTAQKAACDRGENLITIPKNYSEYKKYSDAIEEAQLKLGGCGDMNGPACKSVREQLRKATDELFNFRIQQPTMREHLRMVLDEIKGSGGKLQNIIISGHDGGGFYGGHKGELSRWEILEVMKDFTSINQVKSLMLLGCYTATHKDVADWKNVFPEAAMIAGYDGSAPLANRPQGHQFISDFLTKEKLLLKQADDKKLQALVSSNLAGLNSALYVECSQVKGEEKGYYYGSKSSRQFRPFDFKECLEKKTELQEMAAKIQKYISGELEPPLDTQRGELRVLYNKARANEHCSEVTEVFINTNALFNLLFHEGVKQNFSEYYKTDLAEVTELLKNLGPEEIEKNILDKIARQEQAIQRLKEKMELNGISEADEEKMNLINSSKKSLMTSLADLKREENKIWVPDSKNLKVKSRKEILKNIHNIHRVLSAQGAKGEQRRALSWLSSVSQRHLERFQHPFSWHEYTGENIQNLENAIRFRDFQEYLVPE